MSRLAQLQKADRVKVPGGTFISIFLSDETLERLERYSENNDTWGPGARSPEDLAEAAVEEAALMATR
jgi:hypothetical protein